MQNIFLAIPFYFLWNFLVPIYFSQLPEVYKHIPFWHIVGGFLIISILRRIIFSDGNWPILFKVNKFKFDSRVKSHRSYQDSENIKDVN